MKGKWFSCVVFMSSAKRLLQAYTQKLCADFLYWLLHSQPEKIFKNIIFKQEHSFFRIKGQETKKE